MSLTMIATCWNQRSLLWASAGRGRLASVSPGELDRLVAELHPHHPHPEPENAFQVLVVGSRDLDVRDLLEREHRGIELGRAVHVGDRHPDRTHGADRNPWGNGHAPGR